MAANIEGAGNALPGVFTRTESITDGVSVPSGSRIPVLMGEGERSEVVVSSALGGGNDGIPFDGERDGRHFQLGGQEDIGPLIRNRTRIFRNGIELSVLEEPIDEEEFDSRYDVRVDINTAQIELQRASFVDQGGSLYRPGNNIGDGTISNISLLDPNAPSETWTARVVSVRRDGYGNPIDGYAKFVVRGSVSGILLDGYGNQVVWQSDGQTRNNGVLQFSITEGSIPFLEGDTFIMQISGGSLRSGEALTANYIPQIDINDPQFFTDINMLTAKHGRASLANRISLGAQLAWANGAPGAYALQTAPALPRRQSFVLIESANGESDLEELTFALPLGVIPDSDSNINFFVRNPVTGIENQIIPNKVDFYNSTISGNPASFVFGSEYEYSYTVILDDSVQKNADDGILNVTSATTATLSSSSVQFGLDDLSATRSVRILNSTEGNDGVYNIVSVSGGVVTITAPGGFVSEENVQFKVLDSETTSARILLSSDLALTLGQRLRCTLVDTRDADFFDAGWVNAYDAIERIDIDMVVPLPSQTISAIFQNGKVHVETMSNIRNRRERILLIGAIKGLTPEAVIGTRLAAVEDIGILEGIQGDNVSEILAGDTEDLADYGVHNNYGDSFRVVYFYPDEIVVQTGASRVVADGFFIAAAAAGWFAGQNSINEPLTNKTLTGFTITRDKLFSPTVEENIAAAGVCLLRPLATGGTVLHGKTTTSSLIPEEEEISIVFIRDRIAKDMRLSFRPFIGKAENPTFDQTLFARATSMMQSFLSRRYITRYKDLTINRDPVEPRQFNVSVKVQPVYGISWIYIKIGIGVL